MGKNLLNLLLGAILLVSLNGCVSAAAADATRAAIEEADNLIRLRWAEEWKPALIEEAKAMTQEAKKAAVEAAVIKLDQYKAESTGKLEQIGVKVDSFDTNNDGQVSGLETIALLKEIKEKNENSPTPLTWLEILMAVGAAYIPLTGAKELAKKVGNGSKPA